MHTETAQVKPAKYQLVVFVAAFSAFLATFNETFLNVSFSAIMADYGISVGTVQWLATAYMLGAAVMVPVSAFLYRSIKTRPLYLVTVGLLILGSIIGALSVNFPMLLAGRIVQALGTGMLIPIGMNITLEVAPRHKLGTYMGIMGAMTTLGPSSSVILAGILLRAFEWRVLLWFFGGLSLLCFLCGLAFLTNVAHLTHPRLDVPSVILIGLALIGILYGVSTMFGGNVPLAAAAAVIGILCMVVFVRRQGNLTEPLIQLSPLKIGAFTVGVIINMLSLLVIFAMNIVMPLFMQGGLQFTAFDASMVLFPAILLSCVVSPIAGRIYDKHGPRVLLPLGFFFIGLCTLALGLTASMGSSILLAVLYIPVICGSALIIGPVQSFALSHLSPEQNPHGVTVMSTGFQIAGCIGSSVFVGVFGLYTAPGDGFFAVCLLAAAVAVVGLLAAVYITNRRKEAKAAAVEKAATPLDHLTIAQVMQTAVYTVSENSSVLAALREMAEKKVSGLPVVDTEGRVKGFIADGDIRHIFQRRGNEYGYASMYPLWHDSRKLEEELAIMAGQNVLDCASTKVVAVDVHDDMELLFKAFTDGRIKKVPVLENGRIVGIVSRSDLLRRMVDSAANFS